MDDEHPAEQRFYFRPDWRAQIPFLLMPVRVGALVVLPLWLGWQAWRWSGDLDIVILFGLLAFSGATYTAHVGEKAVRYLRRLGGECIEVSTSGIRLLPPLGKWRTFPWPEVTELTVVTAGGLLGEGLISVEAGGVPIAIPPYVEGRAELLRLIQIRASLTERAQSWWSTTWRRPTLPAQ